MIVDTEIETKTIPNRPKGDPKELRFTSSISASIFGSPQLCLSICLSDGGVHSNFNTREFNSCEFCWACVTLLETFFPVLDHLWTRDSPMFPLTFEHKMGPYIDRGRSTTRV